jgi:hypothetical protein
MKKNNKGRVKCEHKQNKTQAKPDLMLPGVTFTNILCALFCQYFFAKKLQSQNVTREKQCKALLYQKCSRKMLVKLTSAIMGFHFEHVLIVKVI